MDMYIFKRYCVLQNKRQLTLLIKKLFTCYFIFATLQRLSSIARNVLSYRSVSLLRHFWLPLTINCTSFHAFHGSPTIESV